jgi:uncharacterized protein with gpF-like domain
MAKPFQASKKRLVPKKQAVTLKAIHANRGVEAWYKNQLQDLVARCVANMASHIRASLTEAPLIGGLSMAHDAKNPSTNLKRTMDKWARKWQAKFDRTATELAQKFADRTTKATEGAFMGALQEAGFIVKFKPSPPAMEAYQAVIGENVNLIRNLGRETLDDIQGKVWESVRTGHDMNTLSKQLAEIPGINMRRAALIARDQNNKAKAVLESVRRKELGIKEAIWQHSGGGVTPRPTHVKAGADKVRFDVAKGWYDPAVKKYIWPGTEINCRCVSKAIVPGLSEDFY